jgi:2-polyprenyl-3-methyl-5-hydroxy-6-metoxy-1,4-benzoquinol methylase
MASGSEEMSIFLRARNRVAKSRVALHYLKTGYRHTGERVCPDFPDENFVNHLKVYKFGAQFALGKDVLDVGSGTGYGSAFLADNGAKSVVGIDFSQTAVDFSRTRYVRNNLKFIQMDAHHLSFPDQSFDFVFSSENMEHLARPNENVSEVKRVLRPGGIFMVGTPNKEISSPDHDPHNEFHEIEFTFEGLKKLLLVFDNVHIFESTLESPTEAGRLMKRERVARGALGIQPGGAGNMRVGNLNVDLTHLLNTHSFLALAW